MASTTEEVLRRHVKCFSEGDLEGIVSDYSADAVLFTPNGPLRGHDPIREFFRALIKEFGHLAPRSRCSFSRSTATSRTRCGPLKQPTTYTRWRPIRRSCE